MKRYAWSFVVWCVVAPVLIRGMEKQELDSSRQPRPILLWDIHGVILQKDYPATLQALWDYPAKWHTLMNRSFLYNLCVLVWSSFSTEVVSHEFIELSRRHEEPAFGQLILAWGTAYQPIEGTIAIIKLLHDCGFEQHIGSNIDRELLDALQERHANLRRLFEEQFDMSAAQLLEVDQTDNSIIKKPQFRFYGRYLEKTNNRDFKKGPVIFIDDRQKNITAAERLGMTGILFEDPEQLKQKLQEILGIKLATCAKK